MDSHPVDEHENNDDEFVADLLRTLDTDAVPVSQQWIDQVTAEAGDEFVRSHPDEASNGKTANQGLWTRKRKLVARTAVAVAAVAASLLLFVVSPLGLADGSNTLGWILDKTLESGTLHLTMSHDGKVTDVWVRNPGQVRVEESGSRYQIAAGSQWWKIDEETNTVERSLSPWYRSSDKPVDLLAMLGLDESSAASFRKSESSETRIIDGLSCHVFQLPSVTRSDGRRLLIEALAEVETGNLLSITAWPPGDRNAAPLAELRLISRDIQIEESQFVVDSSLSHDGRIGKVVDSQGVVSLRPVMGNRWTPVSHKMVVKPGDWLRTDIRGANAMSLTTTSQFHVTAGPGSLVELQSARQLKLLSGEVRISGEPSSSSAMELLGPANQRISIRGDQSVHYRLEGQGTDAKLVSVLQEPVWLQGFEGTSANESIGSLICNIDGRSTPLSVGFHKVKVEIRDQIARTTIEESFVNHTSRTLEGIFHFPLPQNASISGFGMWINGELVEADVVEKQRAREIYETILREKRDPGLLEWAGGNIFKARVFPIPAGSEKRIRIVYTQVLPLRANRFHYTYGLRSELLQTNPLRELSVEIQVNSTVPIKDISCATHDIRSQLTNHSAQVEFSAQEYTPTSDFEVVCELETAPSNVVVIPHQRGDDGYFLVQFTPPAAEGNWQRELLPDGQPLTVFLVCDTSSSMDTKKRAQQKEFVASVLAALGPEDRFNLAVCDVTCDWLHADAVKPADSNKAKAIEWLEQRISLGWTDLDRMVNSVNRKLDDRTHVVYVGDGIVTARDASPHSFANRLKRVTATSEKGTFHTVSVGNSYESTVLQALARAGHGSVRQISGDRTPRKIAFELLNEIARPGLENLEIEFRGLNVAAVYPDTLPNLPAGTQHILVGRYLPGEEVQSGEIVISGQRDGIPMQYAARVSLTESESGNSFIPRLWARAHLDSLLEQGSSSFIRDEIISMSEEFHIITPYTSLLVLETDEDRERFGVKRRFQMRDGERFFAEGNAVARFELLSQQMKRAGDWRQNLRRNVLSEFSQLGRNSHWWHQIDEQSKQTGYATNGSLSFGNGGLQLLDRQVRLNRLGGDVRDYMAAYSDSFFNQKGRELTRIKSAELFDSRSSSEREWDHSILPSNENSLIDIFEISEQASAPREESDELWPQANPMFEARLSSLGSNRFNQRQQAFDGYLAKLPHSSNGRGWNELSSLTGKFDEAFYRRYQPHGGQVDTTRYVHWINSLFPSVPGVADLTKPVNSTWPEAAMAISRSLMHPISLDQGGIEVVRQTENFDPRWNRQTGRTRHLDLYSSGKWLSYSISPSSQTIVNWCDGERRGVFSRAFQTGRTRKSHVRDLESFLPGQRAFASDPLHTTYNSYLAEIHRPNENEIQLDLTHSKNKTSPTLHIRIDATRNVVRDVEWRSQGKVTHRTRYSDYVQAAGGWWPGKIESFDSRGRPTSVTIQTVNELDSETLDSRVVAETSGHDEGLFLSMPLPSIAESDVAVADGSAGFRHRMILLTKACMIQDWNSALGHLAAMELLKPESRWIRAAVLIAARRNEEARRVLHDLAELVNQQVPHDDFYLAGYILDQLGTIGDQNELMELQDMLKPVFDRQPEVVDGRRQWDLRRVRSLRSNGQTAMMLDLQRQLATSSPWDISAQVALARDLANSSQLEAAFEWIRQEIDRVAERNQGELWQLRNLYATLLREQGRADELVAFFKEWDATNPIYQNISLQYLDALNLADRTDDAYALAKEWLDAGRIAEAMKPETLARLNGAVGFALGQRFQNYMNWIEPEWLKPLADTALYYVDHQHHFHVASTIIDNGRFQDSDESDEIRIEIARRLSSSIERLQVDILSAFVRWTINDGHISHAEWTTIVAQLRERWSQSSEADEHKALGAILVQIYSAHFHDCELLPFMRIQIEQAEEDGDTGLAASLTQALFAELLSRDWQSDHEAESFALIERLSASESGSQRLASHISGLHRFVDRMLQARYQIDAKKLQDKDHPESLTRKELAARYSGFRKKARTGLAEFLSGDSFQFNDERLSTWVRLEKMYLDIRLQRDLQQVAEKCLVILGEKPVADPPLPDVADEKTMEVVHEQAHHRLLIDRALAMLNYLAVRRDASPDLVDHLLGYSAAGVRLENEAATYWKQFRFAFLIGLDRPDELETELRAWIRDETYPVAWQVNLSKLLAERGNLDEAIELLEMVERKSTLTPADYASLGGWYLATEQKNRYRDARIRFFKSMEENNIYRWLHQNRQPWYRTDVPLPTELDENVLFAFKALFEKSNQPGNYVDELKEFYAACRDFRLLQMLPDSLTGRTPQQIYPFLESLDDNLLTEVRKEATVVELMSRLREIRRQLESRDTEPVDRRALDLFESMIERRAANVLNQPGPHVDAAVEALKRAFEHQWAKGELRQMSNLLYQLGKVKHPKLNDERLRQLGELYQMTSPGTEERLWIGLYRSSVLFWPCNRQDEGLSMMEIVIGEFEESLTGGWPTHLQEPLNGYIRMLEEAKRFSTGEEILNRHLVLQRSEQQRLWLTRRQNRLYHRALADNGQVSLGSDRELFENLELHLLEQAGWVADNHRQQVLELLLKVYRTANQRNIRSCKQHLKKFAFELLPPILRTQTNNYRSLVGTTFGTVEDLLGAHDALAFLIERFETWPQRLENTWESAWQQFSWQLANGFNQVKADLKKQDPENLESRLLGLVLKELRRELESRQNRNIYFYDDNYHDYFWKEKADDFLRVAEEVVAERADSARSVTFIANYLYHGLNQTNRAIELMFAANRKGLLNTASQIVLVDYLHGSGRFGESVAILEPVVNENPDSMGFRTRLITAYHRSSQHDQSNTLLAETDQYFRQSGRWTESSIAQLAQCCLENKFFETAVGYYAELIPLHQRTAPNRGIGNGTLSEYYRQQALAYSGLGQTIQAVDSAAAGVVAWGTSKNQRDSASHWIEEVLSDAGDLDEYVSYRDKQAEMTGQDSPLIRQKIGVIYSRRKQFQKAKVQFLSAIELQPANLQTRRELIAACDAMNDEQGAIQQTMALLDFERHNLELYKQLAHRLKSDETLAERAVTSIVEAAPNEAEHHQALAEIRQTQNRWGEAIDQWQHVARLRALEPNGLLKLTEALIHEERWDEARDSIARLNQTQWAARFHDVEQQTRSLQQKLPEMP